MCSIKTERQGYDVLYYDRKTGLLCALLKGYDVLY